MMGRVLSLLSKLNNRWVIRSAAVALVVATLGGGVYLGVQRFGKKDVPTKKVVTGVGTGDASAESLAASLAPPTTLAPPSTTPPSTSVPSPSKYGDYGQYGSASDNSIPNPYRQASAATATDADIEQPPTTNPYGYSGYGASTQPSTSYGSYGDSDEAAPVQVAAAESGTPAESPYAANPATDDAPVEPTYGGASASATANPPPGDAYSTTPSSDAVPNPYAPSVGGYASPSVPSNSIPLPPNSLGGASASLNPPPSTLQPLDASPAPIPSAESPSALSPRTLGGPSSVAGEGVGAPGDRHLEGLQAPSITIEKLAPPEIQVGKQATFEIRVRNVGQTPAASVVVADHVPRGTTLVDAKPEYTRAADGGLLWNLGTLQPGAEVAIQMQVMPQTEGEVGSVASVTFAAQATSRSVCTRPLVSVEHTAPPKVMIGQPLTMAITVSNPGTGAATGIVVEEDVPDGLVHAAGTELEYEIGVLRPGESKRLELALKAEKPGLIENTIVVRGEGNLSASHRVQIEVVAPQLQVDVSGPKKRFLQRQATYTVSVANPGTAAARDVEVVAFLPRGMKFIETDSQGQYDPQQHAVFWSLEELPAAKTGAVTLVTVPVEAGEQKLRVEGRADLGLATANEQVVQVDAAAELRHTVTDLSDPIEVGSETAYEIRVTNAGTKTATNVRLGAVLPAEMKLVSGEGPTKAMVEGQRVVFEPVARLNPQEEAVFKVYAQGLRPGDHLIRVQLASDEWPTPVSREESTRVYEDR